MTKHIQHTTPETLPQINFKSQPVVTTKQLAGLYGTSKTNIQSNFHNHKARFAEGKHFFYLKGAPLQGFKNECNDIALAGIPKTINSLTLWTERGAARHAKMLDTDQAWDVFERLEDCYFTHHRNAIHHPVSTISPEQQREIQKLVAKVVHEAGTGKKGFAKFYGRIKDRFSVPSYRDVPAEQYGELVAFIQKLEPVPVNGSNGHDLSHIDPALLSLLARCSKRQIAQISSLLAVIMSGVKYTMSLDY